MYILAMETTGAHGSVALLDEQNNICGFKVSKDPMSHLKNLIPMVAELLEETGVAKSQIAYVAASQGPGSFTGIRIGVSTARALCQSLGVKGIAVPTMEGFLAKPEAIAAKDAGKVCCAIINARRGQVYGVVDGYMEPQACMLTDVLDAVLGRIFSEGKEVLFFGDGIDAYQKQIEEALDGKGKYTFADEEYRYQDAASVAKLAFQMKEGGETISYEEFFPEYMRKAEAEQKLAAGQLPICKGPKQE